VTVREADLDREKEEEKERGDGRQQEAGGKEGERRRQLDRWWLHVDIRRSRRELSCRREQAYISSRRIAEDGTHKESRLNQEHFAVIMQMDPTTLQLIQVLERTVSSGEYPAAIVPSRRGRHGATAPASRARSVFSASRIPT